MKYYCKAFDNHICINLGSRIKPCCRFDTIPYEELQFSLNDNRDFNSIFNSDEYEKVRQKMINGEKIKGCDKCYDEEDKGKESLRKYINRKFGENDKRQLEYLEVSIDNECNLACRMCDNQNSSKIAKEIEQFSDDIQKKFYNKALPKSKDWKEIITSNDLSKVKEIKYLGGEPFITQTFNEFISYLSDNNLSKNIELTVYTNSTFFPKKYLKSLLSFKKVFVILSIDGHEKVNEYIRYPFEFSKIKNVAEQWSDLNKKYDVITVKAISVLQPYNFLYLKDLYNWVNNDLEIYWQTQMIKLPYHLNFTTATDECKKYFYDNIYEELQPSRNAYKIMSTLPEYNEINYHNFVYHAKLLDITRNQHMKDFLPEFYEFIKTDYEKVDIDR